MKRKSGLFQLFAYTFLGLFAIMNIVPLFWMVVNSFKQEQEYAISPFSLPDTLQFSNYARAWEVANMDTYF